MYLADITGGLAMNKVLVWLFAMAMVSLFWICGPGDAQELPTQQGVSSFQGTDCQGNQNQRASQNRVSRSSAQSRGERIPKPERNRLGEGKSRKVRSSRKRKKSSNSTSTHKNKGNRKAKPMSGEDANKVANKNSGQKSNGIDDVAERCKNDKEELLDSDNLRIESGWSEEEFQGISLGDKRIDKRFISVAKSLSNQPQVPINQACEDWADTKAAYGLFHNEKATPELILAPHQERTQERMGSHPLVLSVQDTTYFDYTKHPKTKGLGPIGTAGQNHRGLVNHTTLAITPQGLPLGVLAQKIWARDAEDPGSAKKRKSRPIEEKESYKWIESLKEVRRLTPEGVFVVNVCDREADIYEYFQEAENNGDKILFRATQNRCLIEEQECLWDYMNNRPVTGHLEVEVPAKDKQPARIATVEIRFGSVILKPPYRSKSQIKEALEPINIDAVWVKEIHAPDGAEPLDWKLLTNVSVKTNEDAVERISWYKQRWNIETYFKVVKSGCKVENCRFETAQRLIRYLTLMSIVGWRLFWMTKINRTHPDAPCIVVLAEHEWKALYSAIHRTRDLPEQLPTVRQVIRWIARLGGFLGRKNDKEPGPTAIWRGWQRLNDIAATWLLFHSISYG
jgi:hypothetical protein